MKTIAFVLLAAIVVVSCKKSEIDELPPLTSPGLVAKIGGNSVNYGVPMAERQVSTDGTETIFLSAFSGDGNSIEISLSKKGGITGGSYTASNAAFIGVSDGSSYYVTGNNVSIKIISNDGLKVVGSFSGAAQDDVSGLSTSIVEGRFYANF